MRNETFRTLTEEEKQTKLKALLKTKADGHLTEEELQNILMAISVKRQYSVFICKDSRVFDNLLTLKDGWYGCAVFGSAVVGTVDCPGKLSCIDEAAAVILCDTSDIKTVRMLNIYIPENRFQKGITNYE